MKKLGFDRGVSNCDSANDLDTVLLYNFDPSNRGPATLRGELHIRQPRECVETANCDIIKSAQI